MVQEPDDDGDVSIRAVSATASHGGVEDILQTFDEHEMSRDADLKAALHAHPFQTLDGLSSSHRALWEEESGVGLPRLLDSAACWAQEPLTLEELYRIGWRNTTTGRALERLLGETSADRCATSCRQEPYLCCRQAIGRVGLSFVVSASTAGSHQARLHHY